MTLDDDLWMMVQRQHPESLYVCGKTAESIADRWQKSSPQPVAVTRQNPSEINSDWAPTGVHRLALITDTLENLGEAEGTLFLGQFRNFGATSLAVGIVDGTPSWDFNTFIQLGFQRFRHYKMERMSLYTYDIETYNQKRDWNSPEHWANPENWGKYRW